MSAPLLRHSILKNLRQKLSRKEASLGTWLQICSADVAAIIADAGYDWVLIDMEHGSISVSDLPELIDAILLHRSLPIVRVPSTDGSIIKSTLDAGAGGILVPDIRTCEEVRHVINDACWPPVGKRGVGFSRANTYGKHFDKYKEEAEHPFVVVQIEHVDAIKNLSEIVEVEGLDSILIGPYDLSASVNATGRFDNPQYLDCIEEYESFIGKTKVAFGFHVVAPDVDLLREKVRRGYLFNGFGTDALFLIDAARLPLDL